MSTTNIPLTDAWALLVPAGSQFLLSLRPTISGAPSEFAVCDTGEAPTVRGHRVADSSNEGLTRAMIGPGYVYGRQAAGESIAVVSAWTE